MKVLTAPFKELDLPLVAFCSFASLECPEVASFPGCRILLPGIQPVFSRLEFPDHDPSLL